MPIVLPKKVFIAMHRIGVTGANSFVGGAICAYLRERGYQVTAYSRTAIASSDVEQEVFSLSDALPTSMYKQDCIVHAAHSYDIKDDSNVVFAKALAQLQGVQIIYISSIAACAPITPTNYGQTKYAVEQILQRHTIVRAGLVLGQGGLFATMQSTLQKNKIVPCIGLGNQNVYCIHISDLCAVVSACIVKKESQLIHAAYPQAVTYRALVQLIASPKRIVLVPVPKNLAVFGAHVANFFNLSKITRDNIIGLSTNKSINTQHDYDAHGSAWLSPEEAVSQAGKL
ncbi:MAG: hypothetical protein RL660_974 [Bacteroidota bacterium]|jgi:nucleoside-diphosphate-sugar epimerase